MICYVVICCMMLGYTTLCCIMLDSIRMLCAMLCEAVLDNAILLHITLGNAQFIPNQVISRVVHIHNTSLCSNYISYARPHYTMLRYAMLCFTMLNHYIL